MSTLYTSAQSVPNYSLVLTPCESATDICILAYHYCLMHNLAFLSTKISVFYY